jgi:hypothetical protein
MCNTFNIFLKNGFLNKSPRTKKYNLIGKKHAKIQGSIKAVG